jgi:hypothetical protein
LFLYSSKIFWDHPQAGFGTKEPLKFVTRRLAFWLQWLRVNIKTNNYFMSMHRRIFLRNTALTVLGSSVAASLPLEVLAAGRKAVAPSAQIRVGLIGCKGQGWNNITAMLKMPEVQCVALCDVDQNILAQRKADLERSIISRPYIPTTGSCWKTRT